VAQRKIVAHRCPRCAAAGVAPGQSLAHARALLADPNLLVLDHDPAVDRQTLHALARWGTRFLPVVQADPPEPDDAPFIQPLHAPGLLAEITGCQRLYHGEINLLRTLRDRLTRRRIHCTVAAAPTFGAAWALARFQGEPLVIADAEDLPERLDPLPVAALRVEPDVVAELALLGIESIGQLRRLPRRDLPARYGEDLVLRLDQALGYALETIQPVRPRPPVRVQRLFNGPVKQLEAIQQAARLLLADLAAALLQHERGARRIDVVVDRSDLPEERFSLTVSHPTHDARHLAALLAPRLERLQMGFGVEAITLLARDTAALAHEQAGDARLGADLAWRRHEQAAAQLVDTLGNRLGRSAVQRIVAGESHVPEQVFRHQPAADPAPPPREVCLVPAARPSRLFDPPVPIHATAMTPDGPLLQITLHGQTIPLDYSVGPERITEPWWQHAPDTLQDLSPQARDYFRARDPTGQWYWLFRNPRTRAWFLHGRWQ
jgi:protein ImuB